MILSKDEMIRAAILDSASQLFRHFGLQKTTMEDIAREAGKGKSTLYYYYKNKEEIFDAVIQKEKDKIFRTLQQAVNKEETAQKKLEVFLSTKFRLLKEMANLYKVVIGEMRDCKALQHTIRVQYDNLELSILKNILQYGTGSGEFQYQTEDLDVLAVIISSAQRGIEMELIVQDRFVEMESRLHLFTNMILKSICSNKVLQAAV
jgi:AcrR family transcriptional regulator